MGNISKFIDRGLYILDISSLSDCVSYILRCPSSLTVVLWWDGLLANINVSLASVLVVEPVRLCEHYVTLICFWIIMVILGCVQRKYIQHLKKY